MKQAKRTLVILTLALTSCRGPVGSPTATPQTVEVRILATTSTYPLLQDAIAAFPHPGMLLAVDSAAANWRTVYERLLAGEVPFALTSYLPPGTSLWAAAVGQDGIAIVVHSTNPVARLTLDDLRLIFEGRSADWSVLGGPDLPVRVVSREDGADTRLAFEALVMQGQPTTLAARLALSSQSVVEIVSSDPAAIGYVSMAFLDGQVRAVPLEPAPGQPPVAPTREAVSAGTYPLRAPLLVVGVEPPAEGTIYRQWFGWLQSSAGQQVVGRRYGTLQP